MLASQEMHHKIEHMPLCQQVSLLALLVTCRLKNANPSGNLVQTAMSYAVLAICAIVIVLNFSACLYALSQHFPVS